METITITKNNECDDMIVQFQDGDDLNPSLDAVRLFNALIEHLPGGTMTELYRQFVKSARLFDHNVKAASDLLAVAEKADELVQELMGVDRPENMPLVALMPAQMRLLVYELMELANRAIAAAKGGK